MDYIEFASKIKARYPEYSDTSDADLTRALMRKFPEYSDIDTSKMNTTESPLPEATDNDTVQGGVVFMHPTTPEKAKEYADKEIGVTDLPSITKDALVDYINKFKSGPFNEESAPARKWAAEHPGTIAAVASTPFLPGASGLGGALGTAALSMGANAADQSVSKENFDPQEMLASGVAGFVMPAIVNTGSGLIKRIVGPITSRLSEYPKKLADWNKDNELSLALHEIDKDAMQAINDAVSKSSGNINPRSTEKEILEQEKNNVLARLVAIKEHMKKSGSYNDFSEYGNLQKTFENQLEPSDYQAAKYWEKISTPYIELPKPEMPKGMNFLGKYAGDEEALLSPRTWANKLSEHNNPTARLLGNMIVDNKVIPKLAMRAASIAPDVTRTTTIPFASIAPYATLGTGIGAGLDASSYLIDKLIGKK